MIKEHYEKNYSRLIKRFSFRAGGVHQAEDIIQEAYYRALKYYDNCRKEDFDKWFSMIVNNTFKDYMRAEGGFVHLDIPEEELEQAPCSLMDEQTLKEIYELIEKKNAGQQEILNLHVRHGYSPIDISRISEYTYAQTHKCIQRFRQELKELYG